MIKILMFDAAYPPPIVGGKEKQAHLLAKELLSLGVDVRAFSFCHNHNFTEIYEGVLVERIKNRRSLSLPAIVWILLKNRFNYKILHVHTPSTIGKLVSLLGVLLGYSVVFKFPNQYLLNDLKSSRRLLWSLVLSLSKLLVVLESDTRRRLINLGISQNKIFMVPNGVEQELGDCRENEIAEHVNIVYVGRLTKQKRCEDLLQACYLLKQSGLKWRLSLVGDGPCRKQLCELTTSLGLENQISFMGYRNNTKQIMKMSDILVLPSEKEGMSNVLLEAMSIGLPVVATDVGSSRDQLGIFGERFLCPPGDPVCLAEKVKILADNHALVKEYGSYLFSRCGEHFSIASVAKLYLDAYKKI